MTEPLRFVFGVHLHQPVGNAEAVFEDHARNVYRPLLDQVARRGVKPMLFHLSGPLLEWLEAHDSALLDQIGRLVADGSLELLLSGMYEPVLAAIPREDRLEQIARHRAALTARLGAPGAGLWLTERVWEPDLASDLAEAGVDYVLLDDRHFLATGFAREHLGRPWRTEHGGRTVSVLPLDERLRKLLPSSPAAEIEAHFRELHAAKRPLVVFCDDGEKFGGWPQTREWVYGKGWFDAFCDMLDRMRADGSLVLASGAEVLRTVQAGGLAYLPTSSYREMEVWTLPTEAVTRFRRLESDLGTERMASADSAFIRGAHWKNFFVKYNESNHLHKKTLALSALCRERGNPTAARTAVLRAQCNDALWHGVFGGLYLTVLRHPLWRQLAIAERELRAGEPLAADTVDVDEDGAAEVWVHSSRMSAVVAPARGGALIEWIDFGTEVNYADVLTRRLEPYHLQTSSAKKRGAKAGVQTIHEREAAIVVEKRPPVDLDPRALGVVRLIGADVSEQQYADAAYAPIRSWARERCDVAVRATGNDLRVRCAGGDLVVEWTFGRDGDVEAAYAWNAAVCPPGSRMAIEFSVAHGLDVTPQAATTIWKYPIETLGKSEKGLERSTQGQALCVLVAASAGAAVIRLVRPPAASA